MKKIFGIEVDCAICAGKIEKAVASLEEVQSAAVDFARGKMTVEADDAHFPALSKKIRRTAQKIEPDCEIEEI